MSTMPPALDPVALGRTAFAATVNEFARLWFAELAQLAADSTPREVDGTVADAAESVRVRGRPRGWGGVGAEPEGAEGVYRLLAGHVGDAGADVPAVLVTGPVRGPGEGEPDGPPETPKEEPPRDSRRDIHRIYDFVCGHCNKAFKGFPSQKRRADGGKVVYCGRECSGLASSARPRGPRRLPGVEEMIADEEAEYAGSTE